MKRREFLKSIGIVAAGTLVPNVPGFKYDAVYGCVKALKLFDLSTATTKKLFDDYITPGIIASIKESVTRNNLLMEAFKLN